jgi:hypothetical protein
VKLFLNVASTASLFVSCSVVFSAPLVIRNDVEFVPYIDAPEITMFQTGQGPQGARDSTKARIYFDGEMLSVRPSSTDQGSDWYIVQVADDFGLKNISLGRYPTIFESRKHTPPYNPAPFFHIPPGPFYLGFSTGLSFDQTEDRTIFGWIYLARERESPLSPWYNMLRMNGSAVAYDSKGIIIGSTLLVPEPTGAVAMFGLLFLLLILRRGV